ncbi:hypothetical protein PHLCEN_2v11491 [Hermanssonia centrifuga]|uniref:Uncharacterized protein n=1 Tax=Hermanssonia centrifuga TaxID=98765 RepID=A0A2R6NJU8_9APHY|nr:hypothetical protein PHLCEN_2v11491 [Hermanssonia centrifuga]
MLQYPRIGPPLLSTYDTLIAMHPAKFSFSSKCSDELVLRMYRHSVSHVAQQVAGLSHLRLRSLKLAPGPFTPMASFVQAILSTPVLNTLDSLSFINFDNKESLVTAGRLLRGVGPQSLDVCIYLSTSCE